MFLIIRRAPSLLHGYPFPWTRLSCYVINFFPSALWFSCS